MLYKSEKWVSKYFPQTYEIMNKFGIDLNPARIKNIVTSLCDESGAKLSSKEFDGLSNWLYVGGRGKRFCAIREAVRKNYKLSKFVHKQKIEEYKKDVNCLADLFNDKVMLKKHLNSVQFFTPSGLNLGCVGVGVFAASPNSDKQEITVQFYDANGLDTYNGVNAVIHLGKTNTINVRASNDICRVNKGIPHTKRYLMISDLLIKYLKMFGYDIDVAFKTRPPKLNTHMYQDMIVIEIGDKDSDKVVTKDEEISATDTADGIPELNDIDVAFANANSQLNSAIAEQQQLEVKLTTVKQKILTIQLDIDILDKSSKVVKTYLEQKND